MIYCMSRSFFYLFSMGVCCITSCAQFHDPDAQYTYEVPRSAQGEFTVSSLTAEAMDESVAHVTDLIAGEHYKRIDAMLIARNGKLVYENYFHGHSGDVLHNIFSAGKSITSILAGIAIDKGFLENVNTPVVQLLPEYKDFKNADPRKDSITVEDFLNMRSGLACDDWYQGTESDMQRSRDWVKFTLDLPMISNPGEQGSYCTGCSVTLGRIIENRSGLTLQEFANRYLFQPLGIATYQWHIMPDGKASGGGLFFLRPRDMVKVGLLMLNGGAYNGQQVVSKAWVDRCTMTLLKLPGQFDGYGYLWWKQQFSGGIDSYFASGNGGQYIFVIPSKELVVVFTGGNKNTSVGLQVFEIIDKYILPATR
jgi:CubicO group peptidase (beta-lactamase class C family)